MRVRSVVLPIILVNVLIFLVQTFFPAFSAPFILDTSQMFVRPWIIITSMFMHGGAAHLFFNMYALFLFGPLIEMKIGWKRFLGVYFVAGIIAAFGFFIFQTLIIGSKGLALGASGAIMALLGLTIILLPDLRVLFFFFIPMSMRTAGILFALVDVFGLFYQSGVANSAHLAGLAVGLIYGLYLLKTGRTFKKKFTAVKNSKVIDVRNKNIHMNDEQINEYIKKGRL